MRACLILIICVGMVLFLGAHGMEMVYIELPT